MISKLFNLFKSKPKQKKEKNENSKLVVEFLPDSNNVFANVTWDVSNGVNVEEARFISTVFNMINSGDMAHVFKTAIISRGDANGSLNDKEFAKLVIEKIIDPAALKKTQPTQPSSPKPPSSTPSTPSNRPVVYSDKVTNNHFSQNKIKSD